MITSAHNPCLQLARALLGRPKERRQAGAFVAEGVRLVEEALAANWPFRFLLYSETTSQRGRQVVERFRAAGGQVEQVTPSLLDALSDTTNTQGLLAVLENHSLPLPSAASFMLIPDQIRDPGNLGTLLRSALAAGVQAVLLPPETTDAFAPKVVRAGMGAHFRLPLACLAWDEIANLAHGLHVFLADMAGRSCWQCDLTNPLALIVGGEAEGASQPARQLSETAICIPMPGGSESLNAGVAGSLLLFEVVRQRTREVLS